jgi:hypothetical protein
MRLKCLQAKPLSKPLSVLASFDYIIPLLIALDGILSRGLKGFNSVQVRTSVMNRLSERPGEPPMEAAVNDVDVHVHAPEWTRGAVVLVRTTAPRDRARGHESLVYSLWS